MQCEALTTRGRRCRKPGTLYHPHQGREVLVCVEHQRSAHQGTLRVQEVRHG